MLNFMRSMMVQNAEVKTTQLTALQENVGATVSFSATPTEFK